MSDILVIGGGIIGLLTARELVQGGAAVTLIEMGRTGRESSWAGGGIVSPLYPWRYPDAVTALARWSQQVYPDLCAALHAASGIDPEFTPNGLLILDTEERDQALAWAVRQGDEIQLIDGPAVRALEPELGLGASQALRFPAVANVRNPRLAKAARRALDGYLLLREQEEVLDILVAHGHIQGVRTTQGVIHADQVIVCAGAWTGRLLNQFCRPPAIAPVRGQMILFQARPGQVRHTTLYRDRYVIPRRDGRVLVGSTLEHTGFVKATTADARDALYRSALELFPVLEQAPMEAHWSGLRPGAPSGIPYIGAYPGTTGLYVNAGHYRNGVVTAPASARLAADLLLRRAPSINPAPYGLEAPR